MASTTATSAETSGWAVGLALFAGCIMILIGMFSFFEGLAAVVKDQAYVVGPNYAYKIDTTTWGWIHMIWSAVVLGAGFGVLTGRTWARVVGITVISLNALAQFFYIPYYPVWTVLLIALDIACIWALTQYGRNEADMVGY